MPTVANLRKGVCLPLVMPQLIIPEGEEAYDVGNELEVTVEAMGVSYLEAYPVRTFNNYRKSELAKQVTVVSESRHDQLIELRKQGPVVVLHLPNPLQGFSVHADCEQMVELPEGFALSGTDTPIAGIMYPKTLFRDYKTPGLDLAAFRWQPAGYTLYAWAHDDELAFGGDGGSLTDPDAGFSGGLVFFGKCRS